MRKDIHYLTKLDDSHSLTDLFYYISFYSWYRLEQYSKRSIPVGEVAITGTLVSEIDSVLCKDEVKLPIRIFHAKDENVNGNDLEIIVPVDDDRYIIMPCQAKRLYVENVKNLNARYTAIHHLVKKKTLDEKEQIHCLLNYAKNCGGFPLYLFYNYTEYEVDVNEKYPEKELYGCTLANAYHIFQHHFDFEKRKMIPFTFQDIYPTAKPLISFLDTKFLSELRTFLGKSIDSDKLKLQPYNLKELLIQNKWIEHCPPIDGNTTRRNAPKISLTKIIESSNSNTIEEHPFKPKYRILILNKPEINRDINFKL
jgi:hypothetical protein